MKLLFAAIFMMMSFSAAANVLTPQPNAAVAEQMQRLLGTPGARRDVQLALERYQQRSKRLLAAAARLGVPVELLALPLIESRYRNLPARANRLACCSGLWQLDAATARSLGLTVTATVDERLNPSRATDAALRFLVSLKAEFGTWPLAVAAYNLGPTRVRGIIRTSGVHDAWKLVQRRLLGSFLVKVAAASLIFEASRGPDAAQTPEVAALTGARDG